MHLIFSSLHFQRTCTKFWIWVLLWWLNLSVKIEHIYKYYQRCSIHFFERKEFRDTFLILYTFMRIGIKKKRNYHPVQFWEQNFRSVFYVSADDLQDPGGTGKTLGERKEALWFYSTPISLLLLFCSLLWKGNHVYLLATFIVYWWELILHEVKLLFKNCLYLFCSDTLFSWPENNLLKKRIFEIWWLSILTT